ncbi:MAG: hypothetical protein IKL16_03775 [Clostridia bacterium]|nr:hypothetical protein [Clostridia bacterium]
MSRRLRKIIGLTVTGIILAGLITGIVFVVINVTKNPLEGTWISTSDRGSYTFREDGSVKIYYPGDKLPVLETSYNGSLEGTYAYDKSEEVVSITLNVYSKEITALYTYNIENNTLTLTDTETDKSKAYSFLEVDKN